MAASSSRLHHFSWLELLIVSVFDIALDRDG